MKFRLLLCFLLAGSISMQAQFGASVKYQSNSFDKWDDFLATESGSEESIIGNSLEIGLNYWFRLKNQRIEFLPELYYAKRVTDLSLVPSTFAKKN